MATKILCDVCNCEGAKHVSFRLNKTSLEIYGHMLPVTLGNLIEGDFCTEHLMKIEDRLTRALKEATDV